jgi:type IV pilus assembly protein PilM
MASRVGIGLDISDDQIRAVLLRRTRHGVELERLGSTPTPRGAVSGGSVHDPRLLAAGIRQLLRDNDIRGSGLVVGLSGRAAVFRSLQLPKMREDELRAVVAGEMEHYRMVPTGQSTFDFFPLGDPDEEQLQNRLLLAAADRTVVDRHREALRLAGRHMIALEPALPAFCRAAFPFVNEGGAALIGVSARTTELAVFSGGTLSYSRQIDTGSLDLLERGTAGAPPPAQDLGPQQEPPGDGPQLTQVASGEVDMGSLAFELERSLDYYHREMPASSQVERLVLCGEIDRLEGLDDYLADSLRLPVSVCQPFEHMQVRDAEVTRAKLARAGPSFACATGLALHAMGEVPEVSTLDLSDTGRESRLSKIAPKWLSGSLILSIVVVIAALLISLVVGRVLSARKQALAAAQVELERVAQLERERTKAARRAREAITLVELRGLPWSDILFQVSAFMPDGVWVTNVRTERGDMLSLDGTALSPDAVADLMEYLIEAPLFAMPRMIQMRKGSVGRTPVVRYTIKARVVPPRKQPEPSANPSGPGAR